MFMKKQKKGRRLFAWLLSAAMTVTLMPSMAFAASDDTAASKDDGTYVLMNIPYDEFYQAELGENDASVDAVTSSTLNKPRTGGLGGGSYHVNEDGRDISGVTYPVLVKDISQLDGLTEITDESKVEITVTNRGQTATTTYEGPDDLFESAD